MKKLVNENFRSVNEFLNIINNRPNNEIMKFGNSSKDGTYTFTHTNSYEEAENLLINGDKQFLNKIKSSRDYKLKGNISQRRIPYNDIVGFAPNVPNAIRGIPQSMINKTIIKDKSKTVSIIYSPTGNGIIDASEFEKCGIVILNVINKLELSGIRVNLKIACKCSFGNSEYTLCTVKVKDYREHLDLAKISFPIAHPSFFRRFGFKWLETTPNLTDSEYTYGYGHTVPIKEMKDYFKDEKLIDIRDVKHMHYNVDEIIQSFNLK